MELNDRRPLAVVTGASSGVGLELAKQFADHGFDVLMCAGDHELVFAAREVSRHGVRAIPVQANLATFAGCEELYEKVRATGRPVRAAAINLGIAASGNFAREVPLRKDLELIQLNVASTVHLAKRILKEMVERGEGRLLFTCSSASSMPGPLYATYAASRSFIRSFAEAVREELRDTGVTVTAVIPGAIETGDPEKIARQGFHALMAGRERIAAGSLKDRLQVAAARIMKKAA